jgi:hypothetical protein
MSEAAFVLPDETWLCSKCEQEFTEPEAQCIAVCRNCRSHGRWPSCPFTGRPLTDEELQATPPYCRDCGPLVDEEAE